MNPDRPRTYFLGLSAYIKHLAREKVPPIATKISLIAIALLATYFTVIETIDRDFKINKNNSWQIDSRFDDMGLNINEAGLFLTEKEDCQEGLGKDGGSARKRSGKRIVKFGKSSMRSFSIKQPCK